MRVLFAVDFMKQGPEGCVCLYTLKNPSFPDYRCMLSQILIMELFLTYSIDFSDDR